MHRAPRFRNVPVAVTDVTRGGFRRQNYVMGKALNGSVTDEALEVVRAALNRFSQDGRERRSQISAFRVWRFAGFPRMHSSKTY